MNRLNNVTEKFAEKKRTIKLSLAISAGSLALAGCTSSETSAAPSSTTSQTEISTTSQAMPTTTVVKTRIRSAPVGYDVSYPQCGGSLPTGQAFGIVGINGGYSNNFNNCLAGEYKWAESSTGKTPQPKAQLYVWAADPGENYEGTVITDWPKTGTNQYGACNGSDSESCSYQYGFNKAVADANYAKTQLKLSRLATNVWIDIENGSAWQTSIQNNVATLEGYAVALEQEGATVGMYSDSTQFDPIAGSINSGSLNDLPEWVPGGGTVVGAEEDCNPPFTSGGKVGVTQYLQGPYPSKTVSPFDLDYSCFAG